MTEHETAKMIRLYTSNNNIRLYELYYVIPQPDEYDDDASLIGIYSSQTLAQQAADKLKLLEPFSKYPERLEISDTLLNRIEWAEGFVTV